MDKTSKNKAIQDYVLGVLLFALVFQVVVTLITFTISLFAGATLTEAINGVLVNFFPVLGFSAIIWLPFSLICGHLTMKYGVKKALRFTLLAHLGIIAAIIVLRGTCWAVGA